MAIDRRDRLRTNGFTHSVTKSGNVRIARGGRVVCTIGGDRATQLARKLARADEDATQLLLAKASGHYKHGTER